MDITAITSALELGRKAIGLVKGISGLLPNGGEHQSIARQLDQAEQAFKIAEAEAARGLGYRSCKCTWPPQICLSTGFEGHTQKFKCPKCGTILPTDVLPIPGPSYGSRSKKKS